MSVRDLSRNGYRIYLSVISATFVPSLEVCIHCIACYSFVSRFELRRFTYSAWDVAAAQNFAVLASATLKPETRMPAKLFRKSDPRANIRVDVVLMCVVDFRILQLLRKVRVQRRMMPLADLTPGS